MRSGPACVGTFEQVDVGSGRVPAQRVQRHRQRAVLLHRLRVRRPLVVQHRHGEHPGAQAAPDLLVPGQDLVEAERGALGSAADDGVAAGVDGAADVSGAERQERAAVQQQTLGAVVLQEPLQHRTVDLAQVLHRGRRGFRLVCRILARVLPLCASLLSAHLRAAQSGHLSLNEPPLCFSFFLLLFL